MILYEVITSRFNSNISDVLEQRERKKEKRKKEKTNHQRLIREGLRLYKFNERKRERERERERKREIEKRERK